MTRKPVSPELKAAKARLKEVEASLKLVTEEADAAEREYEERCLERNSWLEEKRKAELELEKLLPLKKRTAAMLKGAVAGKNQGKDLVFYYSDQNDRDAAFKLEQLGYVTLNVGSMHVGVLPTEAGRKKAAEG